MSILQIETLTDGTQRYQQRTSLDGTDYLLTFAYSLRRDRWTMSIDGLDGVPRLTGQTIHLNIPLNRRAVDGPPGVLVALPETGIVDAPGLNDLGESVKLYYITADDPLIAGEGS